MTAIFYRLFLIIAALAPLRGAEATNAIPGSSQTFESFNLITQRNIFNQSRGPRSSQRESTAAEPAPRAPSIILVGTMSYAKGTFAFFDGTKPEFKKPAKIGDKIADCEVTQINPASIKVTAGDQELEIKVGQRIQQMEEGNWQLALGSPAAVAGGNSEVTTDPGTSSGGDASEDEALKRLMEKRAKEMNQ